ncbi:membrane fusion protein, cobalt-zinc-cadmium efflux system [Leeuwenhoekiella marinoflava DSM 3653]|uniref:Cobalt-zinc-cadmium efflux system membrane fusion protein n=3 Tax=Leeuwenhoekiella marinoflava TaxID=988 RepID=A0A4Q0PBJ4_9FLAO|nr:cobalt-zinc-cadmium efflux system membrane fusion protein [Leeuwenhoekiella marinoflava]SHF92710.1 membrane fusion protein, cobalt-zinc-cadmium efflux system [Leeuwenhoekiella marinoflava DSM 3653]
MMKNSIKILAQISLLVLLISCGTKENKSDSKEETHERLTDVTVTQAQFKNEGMTLGSIKESSFPDWVEASGMIDVPPENRAVITAFMGGYIKNNPLLIGDAVKKGQVLITLENPEFVEIQQQFQELAEQLNYLKSEYERQQALVAENITSKKNFLKAESEYKRSVATYTGLRKKLQMLHINPERVLQGDYTSQASIYAPITGTIAETFVSKGSYVSSADPIMEIVDVAHIHLELEVFEQDMLKVKKGQKIKFRIPESSDEFYEGEVHLIGNSLNQEGRTVTVHGHLEHEGRTPNFAVGMFIEAQIETGETTAMGIAQESVVDMGDAYYLLQLQQQEGGDYFFNQVQVEIGKTRNGYTEIKNTADFSKGAQFLGKGAFELIKEGSEGHSH